MKYITVVAKDFDEAVRKAREQYGPALRIHSRRDVTGRGGFLWLGSKTHVELTCYLAEEVTVEPPPVEKEIPAEEEPPVVEELPVVDPIALQQEQLMEHAQDLLRSNDFSEQFIESISALVLEALHDYGTDVPQVSEFELMLVDKIVSLITIDLETQIAPPHLCILLGPTGVGKTTTVAKIAALYGLQKDDTLRRSVHMVTIDSFRAGAYEQLSAFGSSLNLPVHRVTHEEDFYRILQQHREIDLLVVDTIGRSPKDADLALKMKTLLSVPDVSTCGFYLAISGAMKREDIRGVLDQYGSYGIRSLIVTKMDETETVGNVLSICHERDLPLLFFTDGQRVPKDIHKASAATVLGYLRGFSLDFEHLWMNQVNGDSLS
jgi:flagellar biosynthesis protein FlhF